MRLLQDRVLVKPDHPKSGIILLTAKELPEWGTVLSVGPGMPDIPMTVKKGDRIFYGKYAGKETKIDGEDFLIIKESDIFAITG